MARRKRPSISERFQAEFGGKRKRQELPYEITTTPGRIQFKTSTGHIFSLPKTPSLSMLQQMQEMTFIPLPNETAISYAQRQQAFHEWIQYLGRVYTTPELRNEVMENQYRMTHAYEWWDKPASMSPKLAKAIEENDPRFLNMQRLFDEMTKPVGDENKGKKLRAEYWKGFYAALASFGLTGQAMDWRGFNEWYKMQKG